MKDLVCPNCNTTFQVDDSTYAAILSQVRTREFDQELKRRETDIEERQKAREESARLRAEKDFESRLAGKDKEIEKLKASNAEELSRLKTANAEELSKLRERLSALQATIENYEVAHKAEMANLENRKQIEFSERLNERDKEILGLKARLESDRLSAENRENQLKELHKQQLSDKQEEIDRLKDFKLKLSTKMLGETLEQHCATVFNQARSYGQFPFATFEKDNTVAEGTKGDFIFRDFIDGREYVSIMFEMKNEADATATKHKNEHFFEKLDKDRNKKNCEYAVLVSMLEQGNELYDAGIVDMGYLYEKMLVIRPQFFLPLLRLITEGARKGFMENRALLAELEAARNESRDFTKFEERIASFRDTFDKNIRGAHAKFEAATSGIDKIIDNLEKQIKLLRDVKENFKTSEQRLMRANEYIGENLTVKKLTHGAPSVRKMIEEAGKE